MHGLGSLLSVGVTILIFCGLECLVRTGSCLVVDLRDRCTWHIFRLDVGTGPGSSETGRHSGARPSWVYNRQPKKRRRRRMCGSESAVMGRHQSGR